MASSTNAPFELLRQVAPLIAKVKGLGMFPGKRKPKPSWCDIDPSDVYVDTIPFESEPVVDEIPEKES